MVSFEGVSLMRRVHDLHPRQAHQLTCQIPVSNRAPDVVEPCGDMGQGLGRGRVSAFVTREGIHIALTAESYKLHVQVSAGEVRRRDGR
jgi:hypothetical protein